MIKEDNRRNSNSHHWNNYSVITWLSQKRIWQKANALCPSAVNKNNKVEDENSTCMPYINARSGKMGDMHALY